MTARGEDPVAAARARGKAEGRCPVGLLDRLATEFYGLDELCSWTGCGKPAPDCEWGLAAPAPEDVARRGGAEGAEGFDMPF